MDQQHGGAPFTGDTCWTGRLALCAYHRRRGHGDQVLVEMQDACGNPALRMSQTPFPLRHGVLDVENRMKRLYSRVQVKHVRARGELAVEVWRVTCPRHAYSTFLGHVEWRLLQLDTLDKEVDK